MIGFQPYETFQLLIETGGVDRTNTLLCAACDAFARRGKPTPAELEQFSTLAQRLFPAAAPAARAKAAATLGRSEDLSPELEELVVRHLGDDLAEWLAKAPRLSEGTMLKVVSTGDVLLGAALARRSDLGSTVLAKLFQMNSRKVYRALATNTSIAPARPLSLRPRPLGADGPPGGLVARRPRRFRRRAARPRLLRPGRSPTASR